jgi:hypothetical protein
MALDKTMVSNVIADNLNNFITVKFLTKTDEERVYNGRMNVQKGLKGNERGRIAAEALRSNGYVTLKTSEGYKCFNLDKVLAMKVGGRHIFCMGAEL